ncbi:carbonic anhydrase 7-like [Belonocnema kinseyi]|uniref:carbonic anhydrase 7-like n=1 Tax=Belonocnema kinseyi TaxID=2817044 RepID=UPI00143DE9BE|nr:carbonic anhydrase 7-like [Belonocnema kinseyi]
MTQPEDAYSYKDAKNWGKKYSQCKGKHQSPITLKDDGPKYFPDHKKMLRLADFDKFPKKLSITNTGHTVEMKADWSGKPPSVTGGPLNGTYVFEKVTFHWAPKKSGYSNPERIFDNLERSLHKVQSLNSTAEVPPFRVASILENSAFLFYEGSLDYPPCSESVSWILYESSYPITDGLKIKLSDGDVSNVRPPQALNNRRINNVYNHKGNEDLEKLINSSQ